MDTSHSLCSAQATLRDRLTKFCNQQLTYMPQLDDVQGNEEPVNKDSNNDISRPVNSNEEEGKGS